MTPALLLRDHPPVRAGLDWLFTHDARVQALGIGINDITAPMRPELSFETLAQIIVAQQLSTKAAATIWARVRAACDVTDPYAAARVPDDVFRAQGLSRQKISYMRDLAGKMVKGEIDPRAWIHAPDADVMAAITSIKGFGKWSAQMALIFNLGRPDVWPAADLGVREGLRIYLGRADRPSGTETEDQGHTLFSGRATAAALILWRAKDKK